MWLNKIKGEGALASPNAEGACAVIKPREWENVGQNEPRNTAENRAGKKLTTTRSSEMESTSSADQDSAGAPFSEEQCQWLQRLAAHWARSLPYGPVVQPSTSTTAATVAAVS